MRAEVVADFRECYAIDLPLAGEGWAAATDEDMARWALLFAQLSPRSRCGQRIDPENRWGDAERLLWAIEHDVRSGFYMFSEDAKKRRNRPKPIQTPGERARNRERADTALAAKGGIAAAYGIDT